VHVFIVGVSTRAAAESAARAGFDVTALDGYADLDQHPAVRALSLPKDFGKTFSHDAVVSAARTISSDAVVYLSDLENHPGAVDALGAGRALWGNASEVLQRIRDPELLAHQFAERGIRAPRVIASKAEEQPDPDVPRWLIKPRASGGGHGVRFWARGEPVSCGHYLQEFVNGVPGSVVFVAAGGRGVTLGTSRQLVGESVFGVSGFRYCGNIMSGDIRKDVTAAATGLVDAVAAAFPLVGVGSVDFIASDGGLRPIEVNPRWSASMELVERARGVSLFGLHADACERAALPVFNLAHSLPIDAAHGKAIVFARHDVIVGNTREWLEDTSIRDVPRQGERIAKGQPICTVFAAGSDDSSCYAGLVERAERVYTQLANR
jgi:uncharacterized protein